MKNKLMNCKFAALVGTVISVLLVAPAAVAQVPDGIYVDPASGVTVDEYKDPAKTPNLANLNENADTRQYVDRELGPLNVGVDLKGGVSDNLFSSSSSEQKGSFAGFGVPVGLRLRSPRTLFDSNYRIDKSFYPQFTEVDNTSQAYTHQLEHHASERDSYFWNLAGGKITSIGQYLPALVEIGSTGVAQGSVGANVLKNTYSTYNAVSSVGMSHLVSEKNKFSGTLTGGWLEQAQSQSTPNAPRQVLRNEIGGLDLRLDHAINPSSKAGLELTNVYIRGLEPHGHDDYTTAELTYGVNLTDHLDVHVAGGPLFSISSNNSASGSRHINNFSYAASGGVGYSIIHTRMEANFSRVLQLSYIQTATTAYQFSGLFDRELTPTLDLTIDTRYVRTDAPATALLSESQFGISGRVNKRIGPNVLLFVSAGRTQQTAPVISGTSASFNRDDIFGGLTVLLGNPIYRRGAH